jgi:hypothetical protein
VGVGGNSVGVAVCEAGRLVSAVLVGEARLAVGLETQPVKARRAARSITAGEFNNRVRSIQRFYIMLLKSCF